MLPSEEIIHPLIAKNTSEFSDKLSPVLVKELRQGFKGISFVIVFIAIQVILAIYIFGTALSPDYNGAGSDISCFIFYSLSIATLIIQPLRGINAISSEIKEKTIDLMTMTKLTAWRIVFGKWVSLVSQSALLIIAVMPYLVMRYFFGGMQLFNELMVLFSIFILSCGLTALMIGISTFPSLIFRGLIALAVSFYIFMGSSMFFLGGGFAFPYLLRFVRFSSAEATVMFSITVLFILYFGWLALDFAASTIAPLAENRATPRRLVGLGVFSLLIIGFLFAPSVDDYLLPILLIAVATPLLVITSVEPSAMVPSLTAPFLKKGSVRKFSRYFLYPGWAAGLNYFLLLFVIVFVVNFFIPDSIERTDLFTLIPIFFNMVLFPLMIIKLFFRNAKTPLTGYLLSTLGMFLMFLLFLFILSVSQSEGIAILFAWLPPVQLYMYKVAASSWKNVPYTKEEVTIIAYLSLILYWTITRFRAENDWKHIKRCEQAFLESMNSDNDE